MHDQASDRGVVHRYVQAVRGRLGDEQLREPAARAAAVLDGDGDPEAKISAALPDQAPERGSSGSRQGEPVPYLSRDPAVSLIQSSVNEALQTRSGQTRSAWQRFLDFVRSLLHPGNFSPDDPDWVVKIAESTLLRLARGNHPFNPRPAQHAIDGAARLVVVGDWGTGLPRAQKVAAQMAREVTEALAQGRQAHVIHLGDIYFSGTAHEVEQHVLAHWPVTREQARAGVTSWSLNGNHDMYSGGFGYFQTLLGDPRFAAQHSPDGAGTSFFHLSSPAWDFVGLDTSWDTDVLSKGSVGRLKAPQADFVASVAAASTRKLVLFSHHQLITVYDPEDLGTELPGKLAPVLDEGRVTAWWWGHEHRCMGFEAAGGVKFPRCLGHGGVPVLQPHALDAPIPHPGTWEARTFVEQDGEHWALFGFAVVDLDGEQLSVRYLDEDGNLVHSEVVG